MNSPVLGLRVAGTVFALMSVAQILRLLTRVEVLVAGHPLPLWPNVLAFLFLAVLSLWMWRLSFAPRKGDSGTGHKGGTSST